MLIESLHGLRAITEAAAHCCFRSFGVRSLYFVLGNALPLYVTGMDSGLIIDCGYQ